MDLLPELTFAWTNRNVSLLPSNSLWNLHDTIDSFYKCSVEIEQSARMRRWHQRRRESWKGTEKAKYRWLRNETKDDAEYIRHNNENIIDRQLQLEAITTEWMTVFQEYRDNPPPEWTAYLTEYHQDIPKGIAGNTPLDQDKYYRRLQKPNDEKAGSFDFWATKEAKRLPFIFGHATCVVFTSIEHHGNWPAHLLEVLVALPTKKDFRAHSTNVLSLVSVCWCPPGHLSGSTTICRGNSLGYLQNCVQGHRRLLAILPGVSPCR